MLIMSRLVRKLLNCRHYGILETKNFNNHLAGKKLKGKPITSGLCFVRTLLSSSYGACPSLEQNFYEDYGATLSNVCLHMDRCNERNFAFSSLSLDRMVSFMKTSDDLDVAPYYFYKYRHSDNNYFLRPWTVHLWAHKCIMFNRTDLLLKVIEDKMQYGLFPNNIIFNQLMDTFLKENDTNSAFAVLQHMFLTEMLESSSSQTLGLLVLLKYYNEKKEEEPLNLIETFKEDTSILKTFGGVLYRIGSFQNDRSMQVLGVAMLAHVELNNDIRTVYQDPWAPLMWTENYLQHALNILKSVESPVSTEVVDLLLSVAEGKQEETLIKIEKEILEEKKMLSSEINFESLVKTASKDIEKSEEDDKVMLEDLMKEWQSERELLYKTEQDIIQQQNEDRAEYYREKEIEEKSHKLAVESLGYWDLAKFDEDGITKPEFKEDSNQMLPHLRENYVPGSMSDIIIETRLQK